MLREGFDVNNICVIVPLRSSEAPILLEQIVGRGLRLMWRGADYEEVKAENRELLLKKKEEPKNYFDILSIIEHPRFLDFYNDLIKDDAAGTVGDLPNKKQSVLGDLITIGLKENHEQYDLFFPVIIQDREEFLKDNAIDINKLAPYKLYSLEQLKRFTSNVSNKFYSQEITVKTTFGTYKVAESVFNAKSYNEFLGKIVQALAVSFEKISSHKVNTFPFMQVNSAHLASVIDRFIRAKLFECPFDPLENENWRVLVINSDRDTSVVAHIVTQLSKVIHEMQQNIDIKEAVVAKHWFSDVSKMKIRENYCVPVSKSIFDFLSYPSNKGLFEKEFIEFLDNDSQVSRFIKIKENYHDFAAITYIRSDGILSRYFCDFIAQIDNDIYLIETKAQKDIDNANVVAKKRSAFDWCNKTNELPKTERAGCLWHYCIVGDELFCRFKTNGANCKDMLDFSQLTKNSTLRQGEFYE
jgi:type III restriction enzyme